MIHPYPSTHAGRNKFLRSRACARARLLGVNPLASGNAPAYSDLMTDSLTDATDIFGNDMPVWMTAAAPTKGAISLAPKTDPDFITLVDLMDSWATMQIAAAFLTGVQQARAESERRPYVAVKGAGKKMRRDLHATGVL